MAVGVVVGVVRECGGECFVGSGCSALVRWIWLCGGYGGLRFSSFEVEG